MRKKSQGFSLLEILISIICFSVGLLGLARYEILTIKANAKLSQQSQAINQSINRASSQQGFSLLEILIASVIGFIIMAAVLSLYVQFKDNFNYQQAQSDLLERGQTTSYLLRRVIQQAGDMGCARTTGDYLKVTNFANSKSGTQALEVRHVGTERVPLAQMGTGLKSGKWSVSDCLHREEVMLTANNHPPLSYQYRDIATLSPLRIETYFVRDSGRENQKGEKIYSLYVNDALSHHTDELIPGVTDLKIQINNQQQVRVDLTLTSIESVAKQGLLKQTWQIKEPLRHG